MSGLRDVLPETTAPDGTDVARLDAETSAYRHDRPRVRSYSSDDFWGEFRPSRALPIHLNGDGLEMGRIDAIRDEAQMVDGKPLRDRADLLLVHRAVCRHALPAELNLAVARLSSRGLYEDPAGRLVAAILDTPEIWSDRLPSPQLSTMSSDESHVFTGSVSMFGEGLSCKGRRPPAAAFAEAAGIGWLDESERRAPIPMALDERPLLALDVLARGLCVPTAVPAATASTQHPRMICEVVPRG